MKETYCVLNLEDINGVKFELDDNFDLNFSFIPKKKVRGFFSFINSILAEDKILNKDTKEVKRIERYFNNDEKYFLNPFNNKWYTQINGDLKRIPFFRVYYRSTFTWRDYLLLYETEEERNKVVEDVKRELSKVTNRKFLNTETGKML